MIFAQKFEILLNSHLKGVPVAGSPHRAPLDARELRGRPRHRRAGAELLRQRGRRPGTKNRGGEDSGME